MRSELADAPFQLTCPRLREEEYNAHRVELGLGHWGADLMSAGQVRNETEDARILLAFSPLHKSALGLASGVVLGSLLAAATTVLVIKGGYPEPNLALLAQFFWGYSVSWRGILIGFLWGFGAGFLLGWGFALIRNAAFWVWLTVIRSRAEMDQYSDFLDHL